MLVGMQLYDLWFHCLWWIQRRETRSAVTRRGSQVGRLNLTLWYLYKITQVTHLSQTPPYTLSKGGAIQTMCCSVSNFNIFNTHVGLLSHHTVIIIRLGTLLPGPPGWEYTRMKSILIKILTLLEYNCVLGSPDSKVKRMIISPTCQSLQKCISDLYMFPWICCCSVTQLFPTPQTAAHQASLSLTMSQSLLKFMSIESMMPSNHLILCRPLLFLPSIFPTIRVFSSESVLHIR